MSNKLLGQDVTISMVAGKEVIDSISAVVSFEVTAMLEIKREGFLGATTDERDETFHGLSGNMEIELRDKKIFTFVDKIIDRATRRTPGVKFNAKATFAFPDGDRLRLLFSDLFFGAVPIQIPGRSEYVKMRFEFESANRPQIIG